VAILGFAIVVAAQNSRPGARTGRARLIDLIAQEDARARALRQEVDRLQDKLVALEQRSVPGNALRSLQEQASRLGALAGLQEVQGPGLQITLRDSTLRRAPSGDPNDLVIHEQDLQAIVNALWAGGAEAMSINGERITTTSAVRCVGNTLLLHGAVYAPPYTIGAVGDRARLRRALERDPFAARFAALAQDLRLGYSVAEVSKLFMPGFHGVI
jgi:uncharacterized protein YlxW (UPF0749 family)